MSAKNFMYIPEDHFGKWGIDTCDTVYGIFDKSGNGYQSVYDSRKECRYVFRSGSAANRSEEERQGIKRAHRHR